MSPRVIDKNLKIRNIVEAAIQVIGQKGFHESKMEDIAKQAGIGKGTVYEYFRSKEELFEKLVEYFHEHLGSIEKMIKDVPVKERISRSIDIAFEMADDNEKFFSFYLQIWSAICNEKNDYIRQKLNGHYLDHLSLFSDYINENKERQKTREIQVRLFFAALEGFWNQTVLDSSLKERREEVKQSLIKIFDF